MREPTKEDVDALVGPATPHFAPQLRARVEELVRDLPGAPSGEAVRAGADRGSGATRLRVVQGRGRPARAEIEARLGGDPEHGARERATPGRK